ncbi:MAG: phosphomethylpyrimidine synthase ThiC [Oligoflexia bacterium]|nr:phosphomethylpyrimidine synthase ThiC [Oligoflexia bacterium]
MEVRTQLELAQQKIVSDEMKVVCEREGISEKLLLKNLACGRAVILKHRLHQCVPVGVGKGLKTKVNSNIGTSKQNVDIESELEKLQVSIKYGADTVMDLSTGGDIRAIRKLMVEQSSIPIGSVPIYDVTAVESDVSKISENDFIEAIRAHVEDGMSFITVHSGLLREFIPLTRKRLLGVVSRGGSFLTKWMSYHQKENPLYTYFDDILKIAKKYDVVLSLGDGLRPGSLKDATDEAQIAELRVLGELVKRSRASGVQVIVEGPGHVPIHQIRENMLLQKQLCDHAPFYVLGPLVTDAALGYDHIACAIGGAMASYYGADFLCYVTPMEHLGLPNIKDVIEGVVATKIAAHAGDVGKDRRHQALDDEMSTHRKNLAWDKMIALAPNVDKIQNLECFKNSTDPCSMCGDLCAIKVYRESGEISQCQQ